jgi:hypothetical protein
MVQSTNQHDLPETKLLFQKDRIMVHDWAQTICEDLRIDPRDLWERNAVSRGWRRLVRGHI